MSLLLAAYIQVIFFLTKSITYCN